MSSVAERLLRKAGITPGMTNPQSNLGRAFRRQGVKKTSEFERIASLPRRDWNVDAEELAAHLTAEFAKPATSCKRDCVCRGRGTMALRPVQAAALADIHDYGGMFGPISVGGGKTLFSFLAPGVCEVERAMVVVPANLRQKTDNDWWKLAVHWKLKPISIESYERLGRASNAQLLENRQPDLLVFDEGHLLKNTKAACTRRVARYLQARNQQGNPCRVAIMSGTLTTKSIREYWHLLRWTLGAQLMPLPTHWPEMMEWADAVDAKSQSAIRMAPGVLAELCNAEEKKAIEYGGDGELEAVRAGFARRLIETPGVIATTSQQYGGSLRITMEDVPALDKLAPHYARLRDDWQTPDGWDFSEAVERWRHARELVCGFYNVWDPRPPTEWMMKRKRWHQFVRETLKHTHLHDSEFQVATACARGTLSSCVDVIELGRQREADVYREWVAIRDTFKPNAVPVWIDDSTLKLAAAWLSKNDGICWVEHPCFGEKLARMTGLPYHGRKGLDQHGKLIDDATGPRIASILANSTGRNLQFAWSKSLVVSCPPNGKVIEQLLGRMHRDGQEADEVHYHFVIACMEQLEGFHKMLSEAEYIEGSTKQPQKLLFADRDIPSLDRLGSMVGPRWGV